MPRFFVAREDIEEGRVLIRRDDAFHIARSLRMAVGDTVTVSNGEGTDYTVRLTRIRDEECCGEILEALPSHTEPECRITLLVAYPKGDKLETVIQKAVELGAYRIVPFESSRCIKRPKAEKADKLKARHARIAEEAAKQCGRSRIPEVLSPVGYREALRIAGESELALLCYEDERGRSIKAALRDAGRVGSISVVVGAEGGFSPEEAGEAHDAGLVSVGLGPRILRCETAPLYALSALSYEYELL